MDKFSAWILSELQQRGWRQSDLARASGLDSAVISNLINARRRAGETSCKAIAKALGYSPEYVFRKAGLLPPQSQRSETINEILHIMQQLDDDNQQDVADYVRLRLMRQEKKKGGQARRAQDTVPAKR